MKMQYLVIPRLQRRDTLLLYVRTVLKLAEFLVDTVRTVQ